MDVKGIMDVLDVMAKKGPTGKRSRKTKLVALTADSAAVLRPVTAAIPEGPP